MNWWSKYIGIPFVDRGRTRAGCDCWGLVRLVYADELRTDLPDLSRSYHSICDKTGISRALDETLPDWQQIDKPDAFDVAVMRTGLSSLHVGVMINPTHMIHTTSGKDSCLERCASLMGDQSGFYRLL